MAKPVILAVDDDPQVLRAYFVESAHDILRKLSGDPVPLPCDPADAAHKRTEATACRDRDGLLGLDISRRIAAAHTEEVAFDSKPGETRFVTRLPIEVTPRKDRFVWRTS